jgi:hypothetical protein
MYIRLEFKEKNFLKLGPGEMIAVLPAPMIFDAMTVNMTTFGARWDMKKWIIEGRIVLDVHSPLLGSHQVEVIGMASELEALAKVLETLFAP